MKKKAVSKICWLQMVTVKLHREDGHVIEGGENDELYVEHITKEQGAFGIFGYSFLANNEDKVAAAKVNGVEISMEGIQDYSYPIARPLFFYIKKAHVGVIPGLMDYVNEFLLVKRQQKDIYWMQVW